MSQVKIPIDHVSRIADEIAADEPLDVTLAAARLATSPETLLEWTHEGLVPHRMVGGRPVFSLGTLLRWKLRGLALCESRNRTRR
jgi:hypothetical protein